MPNSLFEAVPGHTDLDVAASLNEHGQRPDQHDAVEAIFRIAEGKTLPAEISDTHCQRACDLLLAYGQGPLLSLLAHERPIPYTLTIATPDPTVSLLGAEQKAVVLAGVGASWPAKAALSLVLPTSLPTASLQRLQPLLRSPDRLSLRVVVDGCPDRAAFAATLSGRAISTLVIECAVSTNEALQALEGVKADTIGIEIPHAPDEAQRARFEACIIDIVRNANPYRLSVAHATVSASLAARLLQISNWWTQVDVRLEGDVNQLLIQKKEVFQITDLGIHAQSPMFKLSIGTLTLLARLGVTTLTVHGALDLHALVHTLKTMASNKNTLFSRVEGFCMLPVDADIGPTLALLASIKTAVRHQVPSTPPIVAGYRALHPEEAARLAGSGDSNSSMVLTTTGPHAPQATADQLWRDAVQALAPLLMPTRTVHDLLSYLHSSNNKVLTVAVGRAEPAPPSNSIFLADKLRLLRAYDAPHHRVRQLLGTWLGMTSSEMHLSLVQLLADLRFPARPKDRAQDWYQIGLQLQPFHWISDSMRDHKVKVWSASAPTPENIAFQPTTTTTTTTTTTITTSDATTSLGASTVTAGPRQSDVYLSQQPGRVLDFIEPPVQDVLDQLKTDIANVLARAGQDKDLFTYEAALALQVLFESGVVEMPTLSTGTQRAFARLLMEAGQLNLLWHFIPSRSAWQLDVRLPESAHDLAVMVELQRMAPWTNQDLSLHLILSHDLPDQAIRDVATFARATRTGALNLTWDFSSMTDAACWDAVTELVAACPVTALALQQEAVFHRPPADIAHLITFFGKLTSAQMNTLTLDGIGDTDPEPLRKLGAALFQSSVQRLTLANCSGEAARILAQCKPWAELALDASEAVAQALTGPISAQTLSLRLCIEPYVSQDTRRKGAPLIGTANSISRIVRQCEKIGALELWGVRVPLGDLARLLASRSIATLFCEPAAEAPGIMKEAWNLLHKNTSLLEFLPPRRPLRISMGQTLDDGDYNQLLEMTVRNRFLHDPYNADRVAEEHAKGAVRGLAWHFVQGNLFGDQSGVIAHMLDGASALNLSMVNKATYVGARQYWESRIEELVDRFSTSSAPLSAIDERNPFLPFVKNLRQSNWPANVIGEALGRKLHRLLAPPYSGTHLSGSGTADLRQPSEEDAAMVRHLLEAMAYLGAIPAKQWLEVAWGIQAA